MMEPAILSRTFETTEPTSKNTSLLTTTTQSGGKTENNIKKLCSPSSDKTSCGKDLKMASAKHSDSPVSS